MTTMETTITALFGPSTLTILGTYQCTAACKECCFECHAGLSERLSGDEILAAIDQANDFGTIKVVVFSGGECFLLGDDLVRAVHRAHQYGFHVRCVSNGYWATSPKAAQSRLGPLVESGLTELNISTGDDHQEFVPFERVVEGALAAVELGVRATIVVEGHQDSTFKMAQARSHPRLKPHIDSGRLRVISNIWIPFYEDSNIQHDNGLSRDPGARSDVTGCDNILDNLVLTPSGLAASCCGLTMEHIPEMKIGRWDETPLTVLYQKQLSDFLKIWIHTDGPEHIMAWARAQDADGVPLTYGVHPCETCALIHRNTRVRELLVTHYDSLVPEVMHRYFAKKALERYMRRLPEPASTE